MTQSDDLSRRAISEKHVHLRVPPIFITEASLGALQLSLGNTDPPRIFIEAWTEDSKSGKDGGEIPGSGSSENSSFRVVSDKKMLLEFGWRGRGSRVESGRRKGASSWRR